MNTDLRRWMRHPSRTLLLVQLAALLLYPFVGHTAAGQVVSTAISVGVLSAAVWMVHRSPRPGWVAGALALVGIGAWSAYVLLGAPAPGAMPPAAQALATIGALGYAAAYFYAAMSLITYMMGDQRATRDELWAAGATFMLFVEAYAWVFVLCQLWQPDAFQAPGDAQRPLVWVEVLFFSATNFSATGLGDVLPISPVARMLTIVAQWNGVMYMALIVSRLAGMIGRRGSDAAP
ncbi:MAG: ion channel [Lysobacteraceae bacterium]